MPMAGLRKLSLKILLHFYPFSPFSSHKDHFLGVLRRAKEKGQIKINSLLTGRFRRNEWKILNNSFKK